MTLFATFEVHHFPGPPNSVPSSQLRILSRRMRWGGVCKRNVTERWSCGRQKHIYTCRWRRRFRQKTKKSRAVEEFRYCCASRQHERRRRPTVSVVVRQRDYTERLCDVLPTLFTLCTDVMCTVWGLWACSGRRMPSIQLLGL